MYKQEFVYDEFKKLLISSDYDLIKKYKIDIDSLLTAIEKNRKPLYDKYSFVYSKIVNNKELFSFRKVCLDNIYDVLAEDLYLRKANQNIKKKFGIQPSDRLKIVKNVICILKELSEKNRDFFLLRTDVKSFFESLNRKSLLERIDNSALISFETKKVVSNLFLSDCFKENQSGLPRGLSISSTLSEIAMKQFDKAVINNPDVFYYARFVDDIIIFSTKKITIDDLSNAAKYYFPSELRFNELKTNYIDFQRLSERDGFQFLGYDFCLKHLEREINNSCNKKNREPGFYIKLSISIAPQKIKKIKTRIISAFLDFKNNNNYLLLENRIKFLTSAYSLMSKRKKIQTSEDAKSVLKSGLAYNYPYINDYSCLKRLDKFLSQVIYSKRKFSRFNLGLNEEQINNLSKISFFKSFISCHFEHFSVDDLAMIKKCWS